MITETGVAGEETSDETLGGVTDVRPGASGELQPGERVDQFEVRAVLGQGGLGRVYLARDTRLGRLVALKVIRPDRMGPARRSQFVAEARTTASFSHPNIVAVFELGDLGDSLYLALEYLDGEALDTRLRGAPLGTTEALRLARDISRALAHAHAYGVVHRDVKPGNVMIPKDGRTRVVDFGLAAPIDGGAFVVAGTPAYMAPETWRGAAATPAADVFALGLMLVEMLGGAHPFAGTKDVRALPALAENAVERVALPGRPEAILALIRRCVARDPTERPTADEVREILDELIDGPAMGTADAGPFVGLRTIGERDTGAFRGRDAELDGALELMRHRPIFAVAGSSGAGKSSFVQAGLLPRLRERGPVTRLLMRPGAHPLQALASVLRSPSSSAEPTPLPGAEPDDTERQLRDHPEALNVRLHELAAATASRVVLVVDQLEEVITQAVHDGAAFLAAIAKAAVEADGPVQVIVTIRDDFLGRLGEFDSFGDALANVMVLGPPRRAQLRTILVEALRRSRHTFDDPALAERVLDDIASERAPLPLLQFVGEALWERRDRHARQLLSSAYAALGGVGGALSQHGDAVLTALPSAQQTTARDLCLRLVGRDGTRLALDAGTLVAGLPADAVAVLEALTQARLLTARRDPGGPLPLYELSHDSIVTTWSTMARWLTDSDADRAFLADLEAAADLWERRGHRGEDCWRGALQTDAHRRIETLAVQPSAIARAFLEAGATLAERSRRVRRRLTIGAAVALVIVAVVATVAAARFRAQEVAAREAATKIDLARSDMGRFVLDAQLFDWDAEHLSTVPVAPSALADLSFAVHRAERLDLHTPGALDPDAHVEVQRSPDGRHVRLRIEARSGHAFLRIDGRGRPGETCGPSWIPVNLPGYAERDTLSVTAPIPTCAATRAGTVAIPAGFFFFSGAGEPPSTHPEYVQAEDRRTLPAYRIDATELPNALMTVWGTLAPLTGQEPPEYPTAPPLDLSGRPDHPATYIDVWTADAICRWLGRRLPTSAEWEKAARGGLTLADGRPNPWPRRNVPWGLPVSPLHANLGANGDGWAGSAPVTAFPDGRGPYGTYNMAGNVAEWTADAADPDHPHGNRTVRDAAWDAAPDSELYWIVKENQRPPPAMDFGLGVRCAE